MGIATFGTLRSVLYERLSLLGGSFIGGSTLASYAPDSFVEWGIPVHVCVRQ